MASPISKCFNLVYSLKGSHNEFLEDNFKTLKKLLKDTFLKGKILWTYFCLAKEIETNGWKHSRSWTLESRNPPSSNLFLKITLPFFDPLQPSCISHRTSYLVSNAKQIYNPWKRQKTNGFLTFFREYTNEALAWNRWTYLVQLFQCSPAFYNIFFILESNEKKKTVQNGLMFQTDCLQISLLILSEFK